jgi:hypothetical protein
MPAELLCYLSEICDLGRTVGTTFESWFSAAAPNPWFRSLAYPRFEIAKMKLALSTV